jgi:hypothetical protein
MSPSNENDGKEGDKTSETESAGDAQNVEDVQAMIQNLLGSMEATTARTGTTTTPSVRRTKEKEAGQVESYFNKIDSRLRLSEAAAGGDGGTRRSLRRKKKGASDDDLMDKFLSKSTKRTSETGGNESFGV